MGVSVDHSFHFGVIKNNCFLDLNKLILRPYDD